MTEMLYANHKSAVFETPCVQDKSFERCLQELDQDNLED